MVELIAGIRKWLLALRGCIVKKQTVSVVEHMCHAPGCRAAISKEKIFCDAHWLVIPKATKLRICSLFVSGKPFCPCFGEMNRDWKAAVDEAYEIIYKRETMGGHS